MRVRASCWTRCSAPADEESKFENAPDGGVFYVFSVPPSCRGGVPSPPGFLGWEELAVLLLVVFTLCCLFHPISLVLPKETGWSPKEKRWGGGAPREVSGPTRLSHSRGRCHSAAKVSASRTYFITRPRGEGLGLEVDWRLKVFCPAFLQKSGRGPGAEPLDARRSARNAPCAKEAQEGVKGGTLAGGSPFAGGPRRPQPMLHHNACGHPPPVVGGTPPLQGVFAFSRLICRTENVPIL